MSKLTKKEILPQKKMKKQQLSQFKKKKTILKRTKRRLFKNKSLIEINLHNMIIVKSEN